MSSSEDAFVISDQTILVYTWVVYAVLLQIINVCGIVTNIINIICFAKQCREDSVNISLLALSVADLGSLTTMVWTCISLTPAVITADLSFDPLEVMYLTTAMTHLSFTRVSGCMTAMITLERCLCITAPLKIKSIITPKRATVITLSVFIIFFFSGAPVWAVNRLEMKFSPFRNKTLIGMVSSENRETVEMSSFAINNFCIPFGAFVIIVVCTTILSVQLRRKSSWRQKNASSQIDKVTSRNQKAAKMVVMISTLFIVCFVPVSTIMMALAFIPSLSVNGRHFNLTILMAGFGYVMENVNSSANIFIYFHMSSKYREHFSHYFCSPNQSHSTHHKNNPNDASTHRVA